VTTRKELDTRAAELAAAQIPYVWATVVRAERPTSARPGDTALVLENGEMLGFVGGACAEAAVRAQAAEALAAGETRLVLIVPEDGPSVEARPGEVVAVNPCLSGGTLEVFLEPEVRPPLILVFGEGPIARALERAGTIFGQQVRSMSEPGVPLPAHATALVVASHGKREGELILAALDAGIAYIGLVASRRRGSAVLDALSLDGPRRSRIHTPAGLDIGARTPGEIALSILAEIVSLSRRRLTPTEPRPGGGGPHPPLASGSRSAAATALDPVCGMMVAAVDATLHAEIAGRRVWFCGSGCRDAYLDAPSQYQLE
jgi:xanthine dehydrogenase accessory factor